MDFGALPPEINSGRMYAGPGSAPLLAAAAAWDGLAIDFHSAAVSYASAVAQLTGGPWSGPASAAMSAAVAPYVAWLYGTAEQAELAATQAGAAASAYEAARAMTVPPPVVAANRCQLLLLVATNILGQNSAAIAAVEAQYGEMWAQDAAAMYGYADASSTASAVTPFDAPPQTTDPEAGSKLTSTMPQALQQLSSSLSSAPAKTWDDFKTYMQQIQKAAATSEQIVQRLFSTPSNTAGIMKSLTPTASSAGAAAPGAAARAAPGLAGFKGLSGGGPASAAVGKAGSIGRLSVPPSWATGAPPASPGAAQLETGTVSAAPDEPRGLLRGVPLTGAGRRTSGFMNRYGFRHTVMPRPPAAG